MGRLRVGLNRNAAGRGAGHQCLLSITESERPNAGRMHTTLCHLLLAEHMGPSGERNGSVGQDEAIR